MNLHVILRDKLIAKNIVPFTSHWVTSLGSSHCQTRHLSTTLQNVDHAFVDGCADHGRDEDCETERFRYSNRGGVSHDFQKFWSDVVVVRIATEGRTTGSLHFASPRLRCSHHLVYCK